MNEKITGQNNTKEGTLDYSLKTRGSVAITAVWAAVATTLFTGGSVLGNILVRQVGPSREDLQREIAEMKDKCHETQHRIEQLRLEMLQIRRNNK